MDTGLIILLILVGLPIYFIPTIIAFNRKHAYRSVIFGLNLFGGVTGLLWLAAFIWAVYPSEKSIIDPIIGNVTGTGIRNAGDTFGAARFGAARGYVAESALSRQIGTHCRNGHAIQDSSTFCEVCGEEVVSHCPNGHLVSSGGDFCSQCGIPITRNCINGHAISPHAKFCTTCGVSISAKIGEEK